ncbi:MAG TPA: SRPBCC family protein [Flavobacterium sp.]|nr:SRPBCC family protein [Flavobacterium sp.]
MKNAQPAITVQIIVNAPIDKVWNSFTAPEHIVNWSFASDDWHTPEAENDLRTGGKFRSKMAAKDGSMSFDFEGEYVKVEEFKKIEYVIADGRHVAVSFEDLGEKVKVAETFDPENMNSPELQQEGWQAILDNFKKYTETL